MAKPKKEELDFDNYSVDTERAQTIRDNINKLRETGWLDDFKLLASELGAHDASVGALGGQLELDGAAAAKVYRGAAGTPVEGFLVAVAGADLCVKLKDQTLLEILSLPKSNEFAILQMHDSVWELMPTIRENLADDLKSARQVKSARQSHFKNMLSK